MLLSLSTGSVMCCTQCVETHCIKKIGSGNGSQVNYLQHTATNTMIFREHNMWKFNSSKSWEGTHSNRRNPKHQPASCWHKTRRCQARHAVIWPWWMDCYCIHSCLESVSGHPLSVRRPAMSLWPKSLPAIFANGSSLRDLRSRDTGQLEKGKHKSLELSGERFMVYRGAIFEIESLIRKCWWSDPVEDSVAHSMSGSLRCHLTRGPITSSLGPWSCAVTCPLWLFTVVILP